MKRIEVEGRSVEEAIDLGLKELSASIGDVEIEVIHEGSKGLFGLFGSRMAKVALKMNDQDDARQKAKALFENALEAPQKAKAPKPQPQKEDAPKKPASKKQEATEEAPAARQAVPAEPAAQLDPATKEGKVQAFLKELTTLMGVNVEVHVHVDEEGAIRVNMQGDALGILIGRRGETLDALQYLTSLQVNKGQETYTRVTLDSEGYRAKREESLVRLANRMANRAKKTGRRVSMEPMNPYERRILHAALQGVEGIQTHSEGDEPNRHVVITLQKGVNPDRDAQ